VPESEFSIIAQDAFGTFEVSQEADLARIFATRDGDGANEIWLFPKRQEYPCLAIHVHGTMAHLHFIPEDGHPGYISQSGQLDDGEVPDEMIVLNTRGSNDSIEVRRDSLVSASAAFVVASEFFRTRARATTIQWFEL
jgi:hypothetical protein